MPSTSTFIRATPDGAISSTLTPGELNVASSALPGEAGRTRVSGLGTQIEFGLASRQRMKGEDSIGEVISLQVALEQNVMLFHRLNSKHSSG